MTEKLPKIVQVFCGELCNSNECNSDIVNLLNRDVNGISSNITIGYEKFVLNPEALPSRIIDLLQIAAYVFCADRLVNRGERDSVNNDSWARAFEFHIPVIDIDFWGKANLQKTMCDALQFMTGDRKFSFSFEEATQSVFDTRNKQISLFTDEISAVSGASNLDVMLFSGGLDSLAGAIQCLNDHQDRNICLVSHKSNNSVTHTQKTITKHLKNKYNDRVLPYGFECHNRSIQSRDETQRSRMFLFSAIAFSICNCFDRHEFYVYENGITSINLPKQGDVINSRASRTTHPKTLGLLKKFYNLFDNSFDIIVPYYNKTKTDVLHVFRKYGEESIISSSVSCSATRNKPGISTHCGCCSQCIERRFATYASGLVDFDVTYAEDFIRDVPNNETKQRLYNTLRLACAEKALTLGEFISNYPDDLVNVIEFWPCDNPDDSLAEIFGLFSRFGDSVLEAAKNMQQKYDDLSVPVVENSFIYMLANREYLKSPFILRVSEIDSLLINAIPTMFQREKPKGENDFNDKVQAILSVKGQFTREYPVLQFGISSYKADHAQDCLIVESKYIRGDTTPSKVTEGIAADMTKIPEKFDVMFVVYDPERKIIADDQYIASFEQRRGSCHVRIYR